MGSRRERPRLGDLHQRQPSFVVNVPQLDHVRTVCGECKDIDTKLRMIVQRGRTTADLAAKQLVKAYWTRDWEVTTLALGEYKLSTGLTFANEARLN